MKRHLLLLLVLLLPITSTCADDTDLPARLQATVEAFNAENPQAPGVVVHIISPRHGLDFTAVTGRADRPEQATVLTADHTFRIASNTKTYVAAGALRLVEIGKLRLADTLAERLPDHYRELLGQDGYDLQAMTVAQLLSHTSGMFEHPADPRYAEAILADPQHHWTAREQVELCVAWGDPVAQPGEEYVYSDTGYITEPGTAGPRAHQYYGPYDTTDWHPSLDLYGGGGLLTSAGDLAWFLRRLLAAEVFEQAETLEQMTGRGKLPYRLGLMREEMAGHLAWGHTGFWNTFAFHLPTLDLTVAGAVLDHHAGRGQELARRLVIEVMADNSTAPGK